MRKKKKRKKVDQSSHLQFATLAQCLQGWFSDQANLGQHVLPHPQATYPSYMDTCHPTLVRQLFSYTGDRPWPLYQGLRDGGFILEKDDGGRGRRLGWIACDLLMGARLPGLLTTSKALGQLRMECTPWTCRMSPPSDAPPRGRGV